MARVAKDVRFLLNVDNYIASTMHLSAANHGELLLLTGAAFMNGGWLPNDDKTLAKIAKCTPRQWRNDRATIAEFFVIDAKRWTHKAEHIKGVKLVFETNGRLPRGEWLILRDRVFERDDFTCTYCGAHDGKLECDHVVPVSRGGTNDEANLATACKPCNSSKHAKTPEEWRRH